jgi:putative endonuclease
MFYVYVMRSVRDEKFYTGFTGDLRKRFNEHNSGKVFSKKKCQGSRSSAR